MIQPLKDIYSLTELLKRVQVSKEERVKLKNEIRKLYGDDLQIMSFITVPWMSVNFCRLPERFQKALRNMFGVNKSLKIFND